MGIAKLTQGLNIALAQLNSKELKALTSIEDIDQWILSQYAFNLANDSFGKAVLATLFNFKNIQLALHETPPTLPTFTQGPLNKNFATYLCEKIYFAAEKNLAQFSENNRGELLVTIDKEEHNLTYLFAEVNFTQIQLEEKASNTLTELEIEAIKEYTNIEYKSANQLLREGKVDIHKLPSIFLITCRLMNALNKMPNHTVLELSSKFDELIEQQQEICIQTINVRERLKEFLLLAQEKKLLTLAECNQVVEYKYVGAVRTTNFVLTGMAFNEGVSASKGNLIEVKQKTNQQIWSTDGIDISNHSSISHECEVLVQSGQQLYIQRLNDNLSVATSINTPALVKPDVYPWLRAMQYAYDKYLSQPFKDKELCGEDIVLGDIHRPNHGLPHAMRKLFYVDAVIAFFAKHEGDELLRNEFNKLTPALINKIKVTLAFYVTGRESEISWRENLEKVASYKQQAVENFKAYASNDPSWTIKQIKKFSKLIQYNEHYFENNKLECLRIVFDTCHQLDLLRCYPAEQMTEAVDEHCFPKTVVDVEGATAAWVQLKKYSLDCCKATGDRIISQIDEAGNYIPAKFPHHYALFQRASLNPLECFALINTVDLPPYLQNEIPKDISKIPHFNYRPDKALSLSSHENQCDLNKKTFWESMFKTPDLLKSLLANQNEETLFEHMCKYLIDILIWQKILDNLSHDKLIDLMLTPFTNDLFGFQWLCEKVKFPCIVLSVLKRANEKPESFKEILLRQNAWGASGFQWLCLEVKDFEVLKYVFSNITKEDLNTAILHKTHGNISGLYCLIPHLNHLTLCQILLSKLNPADFIEGLSIPNNNNRTGYEEFFFKITHPEMWKLILPIIKDHILKFLMAIGSAGTPCFYIICEFVKNYLIWKELLSFLGTTDLLQLLNQENKGKGISGFCIFCQNIRNPLIIAEVLSTLPSAQLLEMLCFELKEEKYNNLSIALAYLKPCSFQVILNILTGEHLKTLLATQFEKSDNHSGFNLVCNINVAEFWEIIFKKIPKGAIANILKLKNIQGQGGIFFASHYFKEAWFWELLLLQLNSIELNEILSSLDDEGIPEISHMFTYTNNSICWELITAPLNSDDLTKMLMIENKNGTAFHPLYTNRIAWDVIIPKLSAEDFKKILFHHPKNLFFTYGAIGNPITPPTFVKIIHQSMLISAFQCYPHRPFFMRKPDPSKTNKLLEILFQLFDEPQKTIDTKTDKLSEIFKTLSSADLEKIHYGAEWYSLISHMLEKLILSKSLRNVLENYAVKIIGTKKNIIKKIL